MNTEEIDKAIKETFKTKIEQKAWMYNFQEILANLEQSKINLAFYQQRLEGFLDMIGLNKLSKQEWREKYHKEINVAGKKIIRTCAYSSVTEKTISSKEETNVRNK